MNESLHDRGIAFLTFPASPTTSIRSDAATIATFPRPAGCGRTRPAIVERDGAHGLIGESPEMLEVVDQVRRIAASQATVMPIRPLSPPMQTVRRLEGGTFGMSGDALAQAREQFRDKLAVAKRGLGDASRIAMDKGRYAASATDDYVRANPWPAVGVALVTGLVAGVLIGRR